MYVAIKEGAAHSKMAAQQSSAGSWIWNLWGHRITFNDKTSKCEDAMLCQSKHFRRVGQWDTNTARWSIGTWVTFLATSCMVKIGWQCQSGSPVVLQYHFAEHCAGLTGSCKHSGWFQPNSMPSRWWMILVTLTWKALKKTRLQQVSEPQTSSLTKRLLTGQNIEDSIHLPSELVETNLQKTILCSVRVVIHIWVNRKLHSVKHR